MPKNSGWPFFSVELGLDYGLLLSSLSLGGTGHPNIIVLHSCQTNNSSLAAFNTTACLSSEEHVRNVDFIIYFI